MQVGHAEQQAGKLPKPASIALLWENTSHGKDFRKGITDFAEKTKGYKVAVDESFELNGKDFSALLGQVKAARADLFLADAHLPDYITMQRQYVTAGLCHKVISYGARGSEKQAAEALGKKNVEHVISAVWWSPLLADKNPDAKKFVDAFKAKYGGRTPEWYQALGFETARALFTAIEQAGSIDRKAVREKLAAMKIPVLLPGLYSTMAYGLGLIYGVLRIVNLNHGGMIMAGAYAGWYLHHALGIDPYLSLLPVAAVSFGVGILIYRLLVRRLPRGAAGGVQSLLLLFGVWLMVRNAAYLMFTGNDQTLRTSYATSALSVGSALISVNWIAVFGVAVTI